ncbi:MAG: helix-turn-helix transcriptional regulator [Bdellovibrionaceae bacterium]|nr:helix-turn-helix transcriptional regulator [Pseudobdellovibrionaceae bacterium]
METKISDILRERLEGQNLSKIARELGISKSLLADWVAARRLPSLKNIKAVAKLAAYLGISLEQLLLGKEDDRKIISAVTFEDEKRSYRVHIERLK